MFDTSRALADMASQIRTYRSTDGLTLQQLAARSGVAASTIHKVEARQMVPTVSVLLKIAKGLGRRPEELIRDQLDEDPAVGALDAPAGAPGDDPLAGAGANPEDGDREATCFARRDVGVWQIDVSADRGLPPLALSSGQRAILIVDRGRLRLQAGGRQLDLTAGDCIEVEGGRIEAQPTPETSARLTLIGSPRGNLDRHLSDLRPPDAFTR